MTLDARISDVLGRLALLADGATSNLDPDRTHHGAPESSIPAGVELRSSEKPPDKRRCSLFQWYGWHFDRTEDPERRASLYLLAEMDYREFRFRVARRVELRSGELVENDRADGGAAERAATERVIDWYESVPALTVAVLEDQREEWVRKARRMHGRNPDDGRPRAEWFGWDEDERRRQVAKLFNRDMGQKTAADRLGVSKRTVQKYWPRELAAA